MINNKIYNEACEILVNYMKNNLDTSKNKYCNKDNWIFTVKHSFRVEAYSMKIKDSFTTLNKEDILTLQTACIFHDIGNVVQREKHALIGSNIIDKLYYKTKYISKSKIDKNRLIKIIADHSNKINCPNDDILSTILKDADILDQIGAMSILMHSSKYTYNSYDFYENILYDIKNKELSFCMKQYSLLKTDCAKNIMKNKIKFIKNFQKQLQYEIIGEINNKDLLQDMY